MRQRADVPTPHRVRESLSLMIENEGDPTLVNGVLISADWMEEMTSRVQSFLAQSDWEKPCYSVNFPGDQVLQAPYNLAAGSEVLWRTTGWIFVCRRVSPDTSGNVIVGVSALVVLLSE